MAFPRIKCITCEQRYATTTNLRCDACKAVELYLGGYLQSEEGRRFVRRKLKASTKKAASQQRPKKQSCKKAYRISAKKKAKWHFLQTGSAFTTTACNYILEGGWRQEAEVADLEKDQLCKRCCLVGGQT